MQAFYPNQRSSSSSWSQSLHKLRRGSQNALTSVRTGSQIRDDGMVAFEQTEGDDWQSLASRPYGFPSEQPERLASP